MSALRWVKSSFSPPTDNDCVECAREGDRMLVRNSNDPAGPVLSYTESEWHAFVAGVRNGELTWDQT